MKKHEKSLVKLGIKYGVDLGGSADEIKYKYITPPRNRLEKSIEKLKKGTNSEEGTDEDNGSPKRYLGAVDDMRVNFILTNVEHIRKQELIYNKSQT